MENYCLFTRPPRPSSIGCCEALEPWGPGATCFTSQRRGINDPIATLSQNLLSLRRKSINLANNIMILRGSLLSKCGSTFMGFAKDNTWKTTYQLVPIPHFLSLHQYLHCSYTAKGSTGRRCESMSQIQVRISAHQMENI